MLSSPGCHGAGLLHVTISPSAIRPRSVRTVEESKRALLVPLHMQRRHRVDPERPSLTFAEDTATRDSTTRRPASLDATTAQTGGLSSSDTFIGPGPSAFDRFRRFRLHDRFLDHVDLTSLRHQQRPPGRLVLYYRRDRIVCGALPRPRRTASA